MIKLLEKEEDEEKHLEEQWSHILNGFNKKASSGTYRFLLEKSSGLAKMLDREVELENHPVIKDIPE